MSKIQQLVNLGKFACGSCAPTAGPLKVQWELTYLCNLRCVHCDSWARPFGNELTPARQLEVIRELAAEGVMNISFSGGETMVVRHLNDLIACGKECGLNISINSNGTLVKPDTAAKLVATGLDTIYLSLDGTAPEVHDAVRGVKGSHQKVLEAAEHLLAARKNGRPKIYFNTVVNRINLADFPGVLEIARRIGIDGGTISLIQSTPNFNAKPESLMRDEDLPLLRKQVERLKHEFENFHPHTADYLDEFETYVKDPEQLKRYRCAAGYAVAEIHPEGKVYPCLVAFAEMGDLRTHSFREIWYSKKSDAIRKDIKEGRHPICWIDCVAPMNLVLDNLRKVNVVKLANATLLKYAFMRGTA
ncbi:MAG: radical SAM protein [Planctomycetes bacterium]|nr:radical SAM protein [Planctomycetota bacterium]MBI3847275.1 radical SAM protein [Planctomycetota bacterium]